MTVADAVNMDRIAQRLVVEVRHGYASPPRFPARWNAVWGAKVDLIEINCGSKPSTARISFPDRRWNAQSALLAKGNILRIRTDEHFAAQRCVLFQGPITARSAGFSGGMGAAAGGFSASHESNVLTCRDYRWLIAATSPLVGQYVRGPDDYIDYGTPAQTPIDSGCTWLSGRRMIFNPDGRPNKDPCLLKMILLAGPCEVPIFAPPDAQFWSARDMIRHCLSPLHNRAASYLPWTDPNDLPGLADTDFDSVLNNIVVDSLNAIEAVELICKHLGWSFREEYNADGPMLVFFKPGRAAGYSRSADRLIIRHYLHAPAVGENISAAVAAGAKMLWSMAIHEDISNVVNLPSGLGSPHRFEFTAELVPAWLDTELVPDTGAALDNLFFTDSDLQSHTAPNILPYYRYYHIRGAAFRRNVARQWCLNESGRYSYSFDRGMPFDFATVIPADHILKKGGARLYAPFKRQLLPCLTLDKESLNSIGIIVEFSFDGGATWQVLPCTIGSLPDECGIYIADPNLCEMADQSEGTISGGVLDGVQLNYWSSLCDDSVNSRSFKAGQWRTRCRVTASVQIDRRIARYAGYFSTAGSPFAQTRVHDFSSMYHLRKRTFASIYDDGPLPADQLDSTGLITDHLDALRQAYHHTAISGLFVLDRLWAGDGSGSPDFLIGDGIEGITGRRYPLWSRLGDHNVYPEIVQIAYRPDEQRMQLVTRDLRLVEVSV